MGILDELGLGGNDAPKDPYGFGNDYWEVALIEAKAPKSENNPFMPQKFVNPYTGISSTGMSYGTNLVYRLTAERYQYFGANNPNQMPGQLGFGQWFQLPPAPWAQSQVPFEPKSVDGQKLLFNWVNLLKGFGFAADEFAKADVKDLVGRKALAIVRAKENDQGFWEFRVVKLKPLPPEGSPEGIGEYTSGPSGNPGESGLSEMERLMRDSKPDDDAVE